MNFIEICNENNISPSYTRMRIFDYLKESKTHPSVDEIYKKLKADLPTLSKTSVYNIVKLFIDHNIVVPVNVSSGELRFEILVEEHSHFKCNECGTVYDIPYIRPKWNKDSLLGFDVQSDEVILKGTCKKCLSKSID